MPENQNPTPAFCLAIICGGPSGERGISLNSARSLIDHLQDLTLDVFYVDQTLEFYRLSRAQCYSNTPSDFDFKLHRTAQALSETELITSLKACDLIFPIIHGAFGEDGQLQHLLESHDLPFVGPSASTCEAMFSKNRAATAMSMLGLPTPIQQVVTQNDDPFTMIDAFYTQHQFKQLVVKPNAGGSSLGVHSTNCPKDAAQHAQNLLATLCDSVLVEPHLTGREFTVIVLQSVNGQPVALVPSEITIEHSGHTIFDYRRKYLPTQNTHWYCPARFDTATLGAITQRAEQLFVHFKCREFARFDGWVLDDGQIMMTDCNPISGMEQNSFIFQQASRIGLNHRTLLQHLLHVACQRLSIPPPPQTRPNSDTRQAVAVLMGGTSAERQVSVMSGSNVFLKLQHSNDYQPSAYFLQSPNQIWKIPLAFMLCHTTEELSAVCLSAVDDLKRLAPDQQRIGQGLKLDLDPQETFSPPQLLTFSQWIATMKAQQAFVWIALHGGIGEDGTLQQQLATAGLSYNGSGPQASRACMDKMQTAKILATLEDPTLRCCQKTRIHCQDIAALSPTDLAARWHALCQQHKTQRLLIKPQMDGCSAGILMLDCPESLQQFARAVSSQERFIAAHTLPHQPEELTLPADPTTPFMIEPFIETDQLAIEHKQLVINARSGWLECTVGVLIDEGKVTVLTPSITVAQKGVLSLAEKFQGGTGINITPPPTNLISAEGIAILKRHLQRVAKTLNLDHYARIDCFFHRTQHETIVIEVNSLPGLTPATVLYHQALCMDPPQYPRTFLEQRITQRLPHRAKQTI